MAKGYSSVLVISDLHAPWQHPDALEFLKAIKKKIKPDFVLNVGDECDAHALSMWESDPDLPSAGDELKMARKVCLLYTSPSPRDGLLSRMPSSA